MYDFFFLKVFYTFWRILNGRELVRSNDTAFWKIICQKSIDYYVSKENVFGNYVLKKMCNVMFIRKVFSYDFYFFQCIHIKIRCTKPVIHTRDNILYVSYTLFLNAFIRYNVYLTPTQESQLFAGLVDWKKYMILVSIKKFYSVLSKFYPLFLFFKSINRLRSEFLGYYFGVLTYRYREGKNKK